MPQSDFTDVLAGIEFKEPEIVQLTDELFEEK